MRIVLDTNVLIAAAYADNSASRRIVTAALRGALTVVASEAVLGEYRVILSRAIRGGRFQDELRQLLANIAVIETTSASVRIPQDPADEKFLATAEAAAATALITSDQHLLAIAAQTEIKILKPAEFVRSHVLP